MIQFIFGALKYPNINTTNSAKVSKMALGYFAIRGGVNDTKESPKMVH